MTDEQLQARIAAIEAFIAEEESAGRAWSGRSVYEALGGSHDILQRYLKTRPTSRAGQRPRTPPTTAEVRQAMAEHPASTLEEELQALTDAETFAENRLGQLEAKSQRELLSESEEIEMVRLERRLGTLAVNIERAQAAVAAQQEQVDVEAFVAAWLPTAQHKRTCYHDFYMAVRQMWTAFQAILSQHDCQIDGLMQLPHRLQRYMLDSFLPDRNTIAARLAGSMIDPQAWHSILCGLSVGQVAPPETLMDNDPGTRALPPRLIQNALNQGQPIERSA